MKETKVKIPLAGSKLYIYGTLRGNHGNPLIILCHGYGGWMHEMLLFNAARYFEKEGYSTLRLSMYGGGEKSRNITDSDVMTHASDIDGVVSFVKEKGTKWIGVAGHSYSGMAIVYSKRQQFDGAALWDPTHTDGYDEPQNKKNLADDFIFVKDLNAYVSGLGSG
jgi:dienelactone hydrolase